LVNEIDNGSDFDKNRVLNLFSNSPYGSKGSL